MAEPNCPVICPSPQVRPMPESIVRRRARVFLVDDHPLVRESLARLINQQSDMEVCGEAEDVSQAVRDIASSRPDAAIVDISLQGSSGLELIKVLKRTMPHCATIVLSMHDERVYAERAIR